VNRHLVRLAGFAAVLALVSGAAALAGAAVGPIDREAPEPEHGAEEEMEMTSEPAGLAIAADGYRLELDTTAAPAGRAVPVSFRVLDDAGRPVRAFEVEHEKRMHLIVVRRDLTGFQHLHPRMRADGTWTATTAPLAPGSYRVFADFKARERHTLGADLTVPGASTPEPLPAAEPVAAAGPYRVTLEAPPVAAGDEVELRFHVTRDGKPAQVGRYLGARGHLVLLREGDVAYLHNHADEDELEFESTFPSAGRYRAFLQFSAGGSVQTAAFTIEVNQ
jgi:hypothetical protein